MNKYLCIAAPHYLEDAAWQELGMPIEALSPLGAAIDFVQLYPNEAGINSLRCSEAENVFTTLAIVIKCCDTGGMTEIYVKIKVAYSIVCAGEVQHMKGTGNASV